MCVEYIYRGGGGGEGWNIYRGAGSWCVWNIYTGGGGYGIYIEFDLATLGDQKPSTLPLDYGARYMGGHDVCVIYIWGGGL